MKTDTRHDTTTGHFCTRSAIDYLRAKLGENEIVAMQQRVSEWNNGNAIGVKLANQWFSECAHSELAPSALACDYLQAKESMVAAIFAIQ